MKISYKIIENVQLPFQYRHFFENEIVSTYNGSESLDVLLDNGQKSFLEVYSEK